MIIMVKPFKKILGFPLTQIISKNRFLWKMYWYFLNEDFFSLQVTKLQCVLHIQSINFPISFLGLHICKAFEDRKCSIL